MKKLILLSLITLMGLNLNAQLVRSRSFQKSDARITWFVRGGLSLNGINGDYVESMKEEAVHEGAKGSFGFKPGFDISVGFERFFGKKNLYWGAELGVGTRGFTFDYKTDNYNDKENMNAFNAKLPIYLGYCHPITEDLKIDAHVGPYVSFDFAGKYSEEDDHWDMGELEDEFNYQRLDVGAAAGIGVWYDRFLLDVTYQRGFMNWMEPYYEYRSSGQGTSHNIIVRLGVAF